MEQIISITSTAVPLRRSDIDTDQIIPSNWLKKVERTGFGAGLFSEWREDPDFVLNNTRYSSAQILIAGPNFGVGSSREHAVWALQDYGFRVVIAPRFGDIFRNNCAKVGVVAVVLPLDMVEELHSGVESDPDLTITIDIENTTVTCPTLGINVQFELDEFTKYRFLNGLDDIGITLLHQDSISAFEENRPTWLPSAKSKN